MTNPYNPPEISNYNQSPPSDDGANTSANEITWRKSKEKLGDPIKNYADAINAQAESAFGSLQGQIDEINSGATFQAASGGQSISTTNLTKLVFGLEIIDTAGCFSDSTFSPPEGDYQLNIQVNFSGLTATTACSIQVIKSGEVHRTRPFNAAGTAYGDIYTWSLLVSSDGSDDFEVHVIGDASYSISEAYFEGFKV